MKLVDTELWRRRCPQGNGLMSRSLGLLSLLLLQSFPGPAAAARPVRPQPQAGQVPQCAAHSALRPPAHGASVAMSRELLERCSKTTCATGQLTAQAALHCFAHACTSLDTACTFCTFCPEPIVYVTRLPTDFFKHFRSLPTSRLSARRLAWSAHWRSRGDWRVCVVEHLG